MRIGIDARLYGPQRTGIGRYVERLVTNLENLDRKNEYVIFLRPENFSLYRPARPNFRKVFASPRWYTLKEQLVLPLLFARERLDLLHVPHFNAPVLYPGKFVVTIHDLIKDKWDPRSVTSRSLPTYAIKYLGYQLIVKEVVRRAAAILTPSGYVKSKIVEKYGVDSKKIAVTYEAGLLAEGGKVRSEKERVAEDVLGRFRIPPPYFLYVGNVYPHKNVGRLLDAVKILNEKIGQSAHLVLAGARDDDHVFRERLEKQILEKDVLKYVTLTGFLSDPDLIDLYRGATAYVQPSLSEGFGLTSLEAMSLGTPVVEADATSLPEVGGEAALYFDPYNPLDMAEKLSQVLRDKQLRAQLSRKGIARAKQFSWEKLAKETLKVYEAVTR